MSSVFENRQARCAHLRRTRQKIQFGPKDQRLFAHKGKRTIPPVHCLASPPALRSFTLITRSYVTVLYFYYIFFLIARLMDVPGQRRMEKIRIRIAGFCVLSVALFNFVIMFRNALMMKSACSCSNVHIHAPARARTARCCPLVDVLRYHGSL